jgi:hypothetical protein
MQRERDLAQRISELEAENRRMREGIRKASGRLNDIADVPLGGATAAVLEAGLYLRAALDSSEEMTPAMNGQAVKEESRDDRS